MNITIYTTSACSFCTMLKEYLSDKGLGFSEKLIDLHDELREEMSQKSNGFLGVPFIVIEKDGKEETVIGFDRGKLDKILI